MAGATEEAVRGKGSSVLSMLDKLGTSIRHKQGLLETLGADTPAERIKALKDSLLRDIPSYIDVCVAGLKAGAILHDPFDLVYDRGFKEGTWGEEVAREYLNKIMSEDTSGFIASVQLKDGADKKYDVVVKFRDGVRAIYNAASKKIGVMFRHGIEWFDDAVIQNVVDFWAWLMAKIYSGWTKVQSWFKPDSLVVAEQAAAA